MIVIHTHAKDQGQRSVSSKNRVETDGWTEMDGVTALPTVLTQSVNIYKHVNKIYYLQQIVTGTGLQVHHCAGLQYTCIL